MQICCKYNTNNNNNKKIFFLTIKIIMLNSSEKCIVKIGRKEDEINLEINLRIRVIIINNHLSSVHYYHKYDKTNKEKE